MREDFTRLLSEHAGILAKVARIYCADRFEREDLLQEMSAQLWRAFPRYDRSRRFSTWAYRVALNVAISHGRKSRRQSDRHSTNDAALETLAAVDPVD